MENSFVSGNSNAVKSFQSLTISEDLLEKVCEAVKAGEKKARSSNTIQSFEVFFRGFRMNISIGRLYVIPASVCSDRKDFPTALLYGCLVKELGTGGEELADMIEKKIGESEFDEYSQLDFDALKEKLFTDGDGEVQSLVLFAPTWWNKREYVTFKFTSDDHKLKNNLRHQVFAAYYDPRLSSAFDALTTNVNTMKVDVTDITPKIPFPFLAENMLQEFPELKKQASAVTPKTFLTFKTADAITQEVLDPQELNVFESLDQALGEAMMPGTETVEEAADANEGGFNAPDSSHEVPRVAASEAEVPLAPHETPFTNVGPGTEAAAAQKDMVPAMKEQIDAPEGTKPLGIEIDSTGVPTPKKAATPMPSMPSRQPAPPQPQGNGIEVGSEWLYRPDGGTYVVQYVDEPSGMVDLSTPDGGSVSADKDAFKGGPRGFVQTASSKNAIRVSFDHPEANRGKVTKFKNSTPDLTSEIGAVYGGGGYQKDTKTPLVDAHIRAHVMDNDTQSKSAMDDHAFEIDAGKWGPNPSSKSASMEDFVAEHIAMEIGDEYEVQSPKSRKAATDREARLNKNRQKVADVPMDIDSIWAELTEDMGPAPQIEIPGEGQSEEGHGSEGEAHDDRPSDGRPRKSDMAKLPESFTTDEPEEEKSLSDSEAESQEDSTPEPQHESEENDTEEEKWHVESAMDDFVKEAFEDMEALPDEAVMQAAQQAIDNDEQVIYDVAANVGQHVDNVKHMSWFVEAVAREIEEENKATAEWTEPAPSEHMGSVKTADTADNPFNMADGDGAPEDKKNSVKKDTTGPDKKNTASVKKADHKQDSDCQVDSETDLCKGCKVHHGDPCPDCEGRGYHKPGCKSSDATPKKADAVQPDVAEAKSEVVSPDTVDADISQPTKSVAEAAKVADDVSGDMNEAKSEVVSPDTVDSSIQQPTKSVAEAAKVSADEEEEHKGPSFSDPAAGFGAIGDIVEALPAVIAAAGDEISEEASFDFGAGDLADLVMEDDEEGE